MEQGAQRERGTRTQTRGGGGGGRERERIGDKLAAVESSFKISSVAPSDVSETKVRPKG